MKASRAAEQVPVDPTALYILTKRILFAVARNVRAAVRLKLEGRGRGEAEADELVNDAFVCLLEALPRWDAGRGELTTFVFDLARRRMWLVARAEHHGVTPEQLHRMDVHHRLPRYHLDVQGDAGRHLRTPDGEAEVRPSLRRVDALRRSLSPADRRLIDLWLEEDGNVTAVVRLLGEKSTTVRDRLRRLFRRVREGQP